MTWRKGMWCIPKVDGEYVARMEDVLDLYAEAPDPKQPVVCIDESPVQLIGEARRPISARPGQLERYDYEYRRNGTINLFVLLDVHRPWRKVKVTERRAAEDYAKCMRDLVDIHYLDAETIRVVQDNLSTHSARRPVSDIPARRSQADPVPLHPQARKLAQHGRNRDRRPARSVPGFAGSTTPNDYAAKSQPGSEGEMRPAPASNGCSQQTRPAPKWAAPILPLPKTHNHRAEPLVVSA
jgi:hypothetical protein